MLKWEKCEVKMLKEKFSLSLSSPHSWESFLINNKGIKERRWGKHYRVDLFCEYFPERITNFSTTFYQKLEVFYVSFDQKPTHQVHVLASLFDFL